MVDSKPRLSILMPIKDQWNMALVALQSLIESDVEFDLYVVDDGSEKDTGDALDNMDVGGHNYYVLHNQFPRGYAANINQFMRETTSPVVMVTNSDVIFSPGVLEHFYRLFTPVNIPVLGPVTSHAHTSQQIKVPPEVSIYDFAKMRRGQYGDKIVTSNELSGFCFMFSRAIYRKMGPFDERFGIGSFEETEWLWRGEHFYNYRYGHCLGVYVHHFGKASFKAQRFDFNKLWENNRDIFKAKKDQKIIGEIVTANPYGNFKLVSKNDDAVIPREKVAHIFDVVNNCEVIDEPVLQIEEHKEDDMSRRATWLHLGCGGIHKDGFINVDARSDAKADIVKDVIEYLKMCVPMSVDVIESYHLIEHLEYQKAKEFLGCCFLVLKSGGKLILEMPNLRQVCKEFADGNNDRVRNIYGLRRNAYDAHLSGWWPELMVDKLEKLGFKDIKIVPAVDYHTKEEPCFRVEAIK